MTIPLKIRYQGFIADLPGAPLGDGPHALTFRLYESPGEATSVWEETQTLQLTGGAFDAILGSEVALALEFDRAFFLGVAVDGAAELETRFELTAAPYSLGARLADGAAVRSLNGLTDVVTLAAGSQVTLTQEGQTITISADVPTTGTTLDRAYDTGGAGFGRQIVADAGAVEITGTDGLMVETSGVGAADAIRASATAGADAISAEHLAGTGSALAIEKRGPGHGIRVLGLGGGHGIAVDHGDAGHGVQIAKVGDGHAVEVMSGGNGQGIHVAHTGKGDGVFVEHDGAGLGVSVVQRGPAHAVEVLNRGFGELKHGVDAETRGRGYGVYGRSGADLPKLRPRLSGVAGTSVERVGVAGTSEVEDGVSGHSAKANGVYGSTDISGSYARWPGSPLGVLGGVKGLSARVQSPDNFAVVGDALGYGTGVFGIGGDEKGHGVVGQSGVEGGGTYTTAGVRGVTLEGKKSSVQDWSLLDETGKSQVGVLGQANERVAVWGESRRSFGVVGDTGTKMRLLDLPSEVAGVYGLAAQEKANGVHGRSKSAGKDDAGVLAEGNGVDKAGTHGAAALEIRNGAIRVSGSNRPAGTFVAPKPHTPILSCKENCPRCDHPHVIGWHADVPLENPLIAMDSIILLTVEVETHYCVHYGAHVLRKVVATGAPSRADIRVYVMGDARGTCSVPDTPIKVHYQIINPLPPDAAS